MGSRRRFTREFKQSVVQQLELRSAAEICRENEIHANLLHRWKKEYESNPQEAFQGNGKAWKIEAQLAHSQRLLGQAHMEIDLLKKSFEKLSALKAEEQRKRCSTK